MTVQYKIHNTGGKEVGNIDLDPEIFGGTIRPDLVHEVVVWQRNKKRSGTHATLNRSKIIATGKKPHKQKGTGRARAGSSVSPLWVGGAVIFGPQPRSYETRMPRQIKKQAMISVLTDKVQKGSLVVLDKLEVSGKTKDFADILKKIGVGKKGAVVVLPKNGEKVTQSARNIQKIATLPIEGLNVYDLMRLQHLVCTQETIKELAEKVKK